MSPWLRLNLRWRYPAPAAHTGERVSMRRLDCSANRTPMATSGLSLITGGFDVPCTFQDPCCPPQARS